MTSERNFLHPMFLKDLDSKLRSFHEHRDDFAKRWQNPSTKSEKPIKQKRSTMQQQRKRSRPLREATAAIRIPFTVAPPPIANLPL